MIIEGLERLLSEVKLYEEANEREAEALLAVEFTDTKERAAISLGEELEVLEIFREPDATLLMESKTFQNIVEGEADFGALIGRSKISESRPINVEVHNPEKAEQVMSAVKFLMTFFFVPGTVKTRKLKPELAGEAHGAHPIPIVYWDGVRYAWYNIEAGETLNEGGERDPYPQALIPLKGEGKLVLDQDELELENKTVYYIPPNSIHMIHAKKSLEVIWLAWQAPV